MSKKVAMGSITRGVLLIADVSGYTRYLGGVELDHAQDILADLLGAVVASTGVMRVAKLEGDAVFCHAPAGELDGAAIVDTIESCYFAFTRRLRTIAHLTTCACDACRKLDGLDLKFVVHFGQYATHVVADREELIGYDVILVHRLLKNRIADASGTRGYALFTTPAIAELGLREFAEGLTPLQVSVDDGDEVDVRVLDLNGRWLELQRTLRTVSDPEVEVCADVEASPAEVWRVMASAAERPNWISVSTGVEQHNARGVPGVGTVNHCFHGSQPSTTDEVVDWAPFEHITFSTTVGPLGRMWVTWGLEALDGDTTRIRHRFAIAEGFAPMSPRVAEAWRERSQADVERLARLVRSRRRG
ncbi:MAG: DUF2652 domain-containing protein [Candidatus Binatia bacterium]